MNELILTSGVAQALRVSEQTVRRLERRGDLPSIRAGNGYRIFKRADIDRYLATQRAQRAKRK